VIRICYEDFSAGTHDVTGFHGRTERGARGATIRLLPGLTTRERRAVLRRLRQEASRGLGPPLPQPQFGLALGLDRVRTSARIVKAIIRLHPAITLLPGVLAMALLALFVAVSADGARGVLAKAPGGRPATVPARSGQDLRSATVLPPSARIKGVPVTTGVSVLAGVRVGTNSAGSPQAGPVAALERYGKVAAHAAMGADVLYLCPPAMTGLGSRQRAG